MKFISPIITDARNKLGGSVFARNRAGVYTRARVSPVQPRTASQQANRAAFATLAGAWRNLTQPQRLAWNSYAPTIVLHDSLGNAYKPSGMQAFISHSRNCILVGGTQVNDAPIGAPSMPAVLITDFELANNSGSWDTFNIEIGGDLQGPPWMVLFSMTGPLSPGISFVGSSLYRTVSYDEDTDGPFNLESQYGALFGVPPSGSMVALRIRHISNETGQSSLWATAQTFVS